MYKTSIPESYSSIFNRRGQHYHQAMVDYPHARRSEFETVLDLLDIQPGMVMCDVPSGGCYVSDFISIPVSLISVETSEVFMRQAQTLDNHRNLICDNISNIPLDTATVDRVLSLAGLHHVEDQAGFYREAARLLRPTGILCIADVRKGSGVDGFLNDFVDQHNSMGHTGEFLCDRTLIQLQSSGFEVLYAEPVTYQWQFESPVAMTRCCQLLFGIDRADPATILEGINHYLGYDQHDGCCRMNWELYCFKAMRLA